MVSTETPSSHSVHYIILFLPGPNRAQPSDSKIFQVLWIFYGPLRTTRTWNAFFSKITSKDLRWTYIGPNHQCSQQYKIGRTVKRLLCGTRGLWLDSKSKKTFFLLIEDQVLTQQTPIRFEWALDSESIGRTGFLGKVPPP